MQPTPPKKTQRVSSILELPSSILADILSRLPVNSISDCIYVCKIWYGILLDPYFASLYRKRPPYISLLLFQHNRDFELLELKWDYNSSQAERTKLLKTPKIPPNQSVAFWGGCNGLICLSHFSYAIDKQSQERIYICNPTVEEYVTLPQPNIEARNCSHRTFGFGCDPITGQYKVLRIAAEMKKGDNKLKSEAEVFTVGVDHTWRNVGDATFPYYHHSDHLSKIPLNGALHWLAGNYSFFIYSFDIKEEKVCLILPPIDNEEKMDVFNVLGVLRNCLCVFSHTGNILSGKVVAWCMRKYGDVESWTKLATIYTRHISRTLYPIATWKDGEILMHGRYHHNKPLLSYGPKQKKIDALPVSFHGNVIHAIPFVMSCASLKNVVKDVQLEVVKMMN